MEQGKYKQTGVFRTARTQAQSIGTDPSGFGDKVPGAAPMKLAKDPLCSSPIQALKPPTTPSFNGT